MASDQQLEKTLLVTGCFYQVANMSAADQQKAIFYATVLNTAQRAEVVTLSSKAQPERTPTVKIASDRHEQNSEAAARDVERLVVTIGKDESHAKGGLAEPNRSNTIRRAGDLDDERFAWTGEIREETPYSWTLVFERKTTRRVGKQPGAR